MKKVTKILTTDSYITERIDVHQNALLGDYDKAGKYFINENIIAELMKMKKIKKSTYNNSMFCVSNNLGIGELVFEVHYNKKVNNGIAKAEIFLLENVYKVNGYYSNTIRTKIGELEESVQGFIDKSYKFFNISLIDDDDGREEVVDFNDLPYPYILAKKQYENTIFRNIEEDIYEAYEEFFQKKMEALKEKNTPFAKEVIKQYEEDLKEARARFLTTDKDNNAKAVNELLDKVVEIEIDAPITKKEDVQDYVEEITESTEKLAQEYEDAKEKGHRKVKKQMPKKEYAHIEEIKESLEKHNEEISEDKIGKTGFDFIEFEIIPQKEEKTKDEKVKDEREREVKEPKPQTKEKTIPEQEKEVTVLTPKKKADEKGVVYENSGSNNEQPNAKDIVSQIKADILMDQEREKKEKAQIEAGKKASVPSPETVKESIVETPVIAVEDKEKDEQISQQTENVNDGIAAEFFDQIIEKTTDIVTGLAEGFVAEMISDGINNKVNQIDGLSEVGNLPSDKINDSSTIPSNTHVDIRLNEEGRLTKSPAIGESTFNSGDREMGGR